MMRLSPYHLPEFPQSLFLEQRRSQRASACLPSTLLWGASDRATRLGARFGLYGLPLPHSLSGMADNSIKYPTKQSIVSRFASWAFGIAFLLAAIGIMGKNVVTTFWLLACALLLLPPSSKWIAKKLNRSIPRWAHIIAGIVGCFALVAIAPPSSQDTQQRAMEPTKQAEQTPPAAVSVSEEDQLRQIVSDVLKGNTNMSKPRFRKVDIMKQAAGGWGVFAEFNGDDNLTANIRKGGIESKMAEVYIALYTSDKDVQTVTVAAYFPLVDRYGNESDGVVLKTSLGKAEAAKVNWSADSSTLRRSILPNIWTMVLVHPEFR